MLLFHRHGEISIFPAVRSPARLIATVNCDRHTSSLTTAQLDLVSEACRLLKLNVSLGGHTGLGACQALTSIFPHPSRECQKAKLFNLSRFAFIKDCFPRVV